MKKIWPFSFYFLYFAAMASFLPFFVLFYQGLGFSGRADRLADRLAAIDYPGRFSFLDRASPMQSDGINW